MSRGLISCALALLLVASATAERKMLQTSAINLSNEFPFYGTCDTKPSNNAITLSGDVQEETLANGNIRACFGINLNNDCPAEINGKPNVCCVGYGGYAANVYKFEILVKESCRNSLIYGAGPEGPVVIEANGVTRQLALNWQATPVGGFTYQKARFTNVDLFADNANVQGARICVTMNKAFTGDNCLGLSNLCKSGSSKCAPDVTLIEADKLPRPASQHACCPLMPKFCPELFGACPAGYKQRPGYDMIQGATRDECCEPMTCSDYGVQCPSPFYAQKPGYATIIGSSRDQCCNPVYCPTLVPDCGPDMKPKNGYATIMGSTRQQCCDPKNCADYGVQCQAPFFVQKVNYASIIGSTRDQCCDPKYCPDLVTCGPSTKPRPNWETIQGSTEAQCCVAKTCSDNGIVCQAPFSVNKPGFAAIIGNSVSECCDQKYCPDFVTCEPTMKQKAGFATIRGNTMAQCCDAKTCADNGVVCQGPFSVQKQNYASIIGNSVPQCCDAKFCPDFVTCGPDMKNKPRWTTIQGTTMEQCCDPKTCADNAVVCQGPYSVNKPTYSAIIGNTVEQCCDPRTCKDFVTCGPTMKNKPGFDGLQGNTMALCCDPKTCRDNNIVCPAPFWVERPTFDAIIGNSVPECCTEKFCPDFVTCTGQWKQRPGFNTFKGTTEQECCVPKTCEDNAVVCNNPYFVRKSGYSTIVGTTVSQCCDQKFCPDFVTCEPRYKNKQGWEAIMGNTESECCDPKLCPDTLGPRETACGDYGEPNPNFDNIVGNTIEECCVPKVEQKFPFPYCRCHGSYNVSEAAKGAAASGDAPEGNLPFRLGSYVSSTQVEATYTEYCFDLQYYGTTAYSSARPTLSEWCAAQKTVNRIEFLSKPECSKRDFTAVYYAEGSETSIPLGVEDQYLFEADGVTPVYNNVIDPSTSSSFTIARAAMKAVKIGPYMEKYGLTLADLAEPAPGTFTPAGKVCMRLKTGSACDNLKEFCGGRYYYYQDNAPPSEAEAVRCEWSIMEGVNQKCCPTQTTLMAL
eukprot:CAMPEP_0202862340 /NCGR_PEP_ID=MMETSP1391-20130828/3408_1 /ASSEMBLY_ACC=CAM_ASM_000867 /TAXON_ID=1034604 /ORGANISM="Chlamydomonas leiostraca, Strain SAG 11-49" /LENGTH=1021 /DNA_ID=CAMNT_0049541869 /DNA_START=63 /DNA_END=3128 /DNA_ORIENTATION=+